MGGIGPVARVRGRPTARKFGRISSALERKRTCGRHRGSLLSKSRHPSLSFSDYESRCAKLAVSLFEGTWWRSLYVPQVVVSDALAEEFERLGEKRWDPAVRTEGKPSGF